MCVGGCHQLFCHLSYEGGRGVEKTSGETTRGLTVANTPPPSQLINDSSLRDIKKWHWSTISSNVLEDIKVDRFGRNRSKIETKMIYNV